MLRGDAIRMVVDHFGMNDTEDTLKLIDAIVTLHGIDAELLKDLVVSFRSAPVTAGEVTDE